MSWCLDKWIQNPKQTLTRTIVFRCTVYISVRPADVFLLIFRSCLRTCSICLKWKKKKEDCSLTNRLINWLIKTPCKFSHLSLLTYHFTYSGYVSLCFPHGLKVWGFWFQLKTYCQLSNLFLKNPNLNHILHSLIYYISPSCRLYENLPSYQL